jgi:hypothetical protein
VLRAGVLNANGIDADEDIMFLGRSYIQPGTIVFPGATQVLTERVLRFSP